MTLIRNWQQWWNTLTPTAKTLPALLLGIYWIFLYGMGDLNSEKLTLGSVILVLAYLGRFPRRILLFLTPLLLTAVVYESQKYFGHHIRARIRVEEPYFFDKFFFGIETPNGVLTPNEWWQQNTHWLLDVIAGFGYIAFIGIFLSIAAYFVFWTTLKGTPKYSASQMRQLSPQVMWSFFWVNMLGYSTYYWYPAAPPWYVALHGLGPAKLDTPANPAGCLRFDEFFGINLFSEWYGRSTDVFGAIPSLHIAYPLVAVFFAFKFGALRSISVGYYLLLCFGAVYLNHHYILDVIWGSVYAVFVSWAVGYYAEIRARKLLVPQGAAAPA